MNISDLLLPSINVEPIKDSELTMLWERSLLDSGFNVKSCNERNTLTDSVLSPIVKSRFINKDIPIHIKVIGRHLNGSFRCHIGTSKASRPIQSVELDQQMRLLAVFFRTENAKSPLVSPEFIFFPTWLLHLFRYTQHGNTPGRTDVRFLENANMAKEDHIYRLNHVLNSLFRFNLRDFDSIKLNNVIELANYLFDHAGLDCPSLPRPIFPSECSLHPQLPIQPTIYTTLILLLHSPRPAKFKPMCLNCNTKFASRRRLCVACYRYQLKHGEARPLRLIVANRPGPKMAEKQEPSPIVIYSKADPKKYCANCSVQETHQWYRNLCGHGHWCETCKSYYLRHNKIRPPELFIKAAKRKVDVRSLVSWSDWSWDTLSDHPAQSPSNSSLSSPYSQPTTPPSEYSTNDPLYRRRSSAFYFCK
ncbi:hypothetical protein G6F56_008902 [Rhizopus delemar]|uniref:GATA-type domain-containing protein n=1 Tax=Rhizopus stolonifer TaxID=4846 RepID=A0A367INN1_RHIST|nr:hypothetical protein G6F56_008902 [Rhizopus delemar]RCH79288.1 hypothetical protein CU098_002871 [Rhizopus stolonifer]